MISFCTTCFKRPKQLAEVFALNVAAISRSACSEWVIINFGNRDETDDYVLNGLKNAPSRVIYGRFEGAFEWHASVAKNIAHHASNGDVLCNLDCDNFIENSPAVIEHYFGIGCRALHLWSGVNRDGTYGKIAVSRQLFQYLGGYDEALYPMGYQDGDFLDRISASNIPVVQCRSSSTVALRNSKEDSVRNCARKEFCWEDYDRINRATSKANIRQGLLKANAQSSLKSSALMIYRGLAS